MKILYVSDAQSIHTRRWAEYFRDQGDEVHVASLRPGKIEGVQVHVLNTYGFGKCGYFLTIPKLRRLASKIKPDIVHAQYVTSYGFLAAVALLKPLIVTAWGGDVLESPRDSIVSRWLARIALKRADRVTAVAEHMKQVIQELGVPAASITAAPFGVDVELFRPPLQPRLLTPPLRIISTRNFAPVYSIHTVIEAVNKLHKRGLDITLDLVGDGPLRQTLEEQVVTLGIKEIVHFHGHVDPSRMVNLLGQAHIFVSSSLSDGNNVSLNEAMACGCIPVATRIPANEQWITHADNGFLFTPGDHEMLAEMIEQAGAMAERDTIVLKNRRIVEECADWRDCARRMRNIYLELSDPKRLI